MKDIKGLKMGKLIRKAVAIMCIFMMVISTVTFVEAVDTNGKITVTNVKPGETYKIFKILTLESYDNDKRTYSYIRNGDDWDGFKCCTKLYKNK